VGKSEHAVRDHYDSAELTRAILDALAAAGKDPEALTPDDLAPIDEFHVRGREASLELAAQLDLGPACRVLDVGSGLGGPARLLAGRGGCHVTGIDITPAFCTAARALTERVGLGDRVDYREGNALDLPFADAAFDVVWTQHAAMNIADKPRLYAEMARVLRPGGRLAIYDVLQGTGGDVVYPAPWAREPSISFLATPDEMRGLLAGAGLEEVSWRDTTAEGRAWFEAMADRIAEHGPPPLGFHILLGPDFAAMAANQRRNLVEDRVALIETVWRRP